MDPLCASLLPNNTTHWLAQCNVSLCSTCGALWECCELCDLHFMFFNVQVCHTLCCVVIRAARHDTLHVCGMHTILHDCMQTSLCTYTSCLCLSPPTPPHTQTHNATTANMTLLAVLHTHTHTAQQYTTPTFSSSVQVVGCVLYWPCPTQSSVWCYPTDVGSWVWSPSTGQTPGGDVPLWCEWGGGWSEWMGSNGRSEWVLNLC